MSENSIAQAPLPLAPCGCPVRYAPEIRGDAADTLIVHDTFRCTGVDEEAGVVYLLWSNRHNAWWRPNAAGYTDDGALAGRYDELTALHYVVQSAQCGIRTQVTCMVAAPDNWTAPTVTEPNRELVLERKDQPDETPEVGPIMLTPPIDEDYWLYRVRLSDKQAVVGFPKFMTVGIGFAVEEDWNTNLPYTCGTEEIFEHIAHNKGDDAIPESDCLAAIAMVQAAATEGAGR